MKQKLIFFFLLLGLFSQAQMVSIGKPMPQVSFDGTSELNYAVELKKGETYIVTVHQNKIDVEAILFDSTGNRVAYTDLADGSNGYDRIEFSPGKDDTYRLLIRSVENGKKEEGTVQMGIKKISKKDLEKRKKTAEYLKVENAKAITTLDISHFWEAYDQLKYSKTLQDSINTIQNVYLDRGTDGLKEFQKVRYFSAELFVERIKKYKKFYQSVRSSTMLPLEMNDLSGLIHDFKDSYSNARSAKICFAVGPMSTGGTISGNYLLIGIEMLAGSQDCDVSEITNENLRQEIVSRKKLEVPDYIRETAMHEYVHTQQRKNSPKACECPLLDNIIREGTASFISEKIIMKKNESTGRTSVYVRENEKKLWEELKANLCSKDMSRWLYNAASSKDRPGDLGYRMGYQLAESYYENAVDKKAALREMIEADNPLIFLDRSGYDLKFRTK